MLLGNHLHKSIAPHTHIVTQIPSESQVTQTRNRCTRSALYIPYRLYHSHTHAHTHRCCCFAWPRSPLALCTPDPICSPDPTRQSGSPAPTGTLHQRDKLAMVQGATPLPVLTTCEQPDSCELPSLQDVP